MTTLAKRWCRIEDLTAVLPNALRWMIAVEDKRGPAVVVSSESTGFFLQFYGGFQRPIVLDIPVARGAPNADVRGEIATAFGTPTLWEGIEFYQQRFGYGTQVIERHAIECATARALAVFLSVFKLGVDEEVVIEELLAGMEHHSRHAVS